MGTEQLLIAALATWQIVEIWHHSRLFADWPFGGRARIELCNTGLCDLLMCPFCLSVSVALFVSITLVLATKLGPFFLPVYFVYAMAISRLANLGNDVFYAWCRTERANHEIVVNTSIKENEA